MALSRDQIDSRRHTIPGRYLVTIHSRQRRDTFSVGIDILTEWRPSTKRKSRSSDGESHGDSAEYVFWTVELEAKGITNFKEDDVIQDGAQFFTVDSIKYEMLRRRQRAFCSLTVDPAALADLD